MRRVASPSAKAVKPLSTRWRELPGEIGVTPDAENQPLDQPLEIIQPLTVGWTSNQSRRTPNGAACDYRSRQWFDSTQGHFREIGSSMVDTTEIRAMIRQTYQAVAPIKDSAVPQLIAHYADMPQSEMDMRDTIAFRVVLREAVHRGI
jgi:hypothetical protein